MLFSRQLSLFGIAFWAISTTGVAAYAQVVPQADPGLIERRFETPSEPQKAPAPVISAPELPSPDAMDASVTFTLKQVTLRGVSVYSESELQSVYTDKIGQTVSLRDVQAIANAITLKYRNDGYVLSQAVIPPQEIDSGIVTIEVVEGFIDNVSIEGELGRRKLIETYVRKIEQLKPLNINALERYLLLANDLPGVTAKAVLRPSPTVQGAADLVVTVSEKKFEGSFSVDNRGTKYIGPVQFTTTLTGNNLMGLYDRTTLRNVTTSDTNELKFFDLLHEEQLGSEGTRLVTILSYSDSEPGADIKDLEIKGESKAFRIGLSHPVIRSRSENFTVRGNFDYRDTDTDILNVDFSEDKLRVLRFGAEYDISDRLNGVNLFDIEVSQGLDIWDATPAGLGRSRADGQEDFTKFNFDISRLQTLTGNWSLLTGVTGQYSLDPLLSQEEFSLGGLGFGQAYDPSELTGDHGLAARAELRYGHYTGYRYFDSYQAYGFYDIGAVWQETSAIMPDSDRESLASTGLGVRFNLNEYLSGDTQIAFPLTRDVAANEDTSPRLFFRLTARF